MGSAGTASEEQRGAIEKETARDPLGGDSEGSLARQMPDVTPTDARSEGRSEQSRTTSTRAANNRKRIFPPTLVRQHPYAAIVGAFALLTAIAAGVIWWLNARDSVSTDDAFIDARTVAVSSQVNGEIVDLPVTDNQLVDSGGVLARIDDRDYQVAVKQAKAQVDQAEASIANLDAQISAQQAKIEQAQEQVIQTQAALTFAREESVRAQDLFRKGVGTEQNAQQTASNLRQAQATVSAAQANLVVNQKQIAVLQTQRRLAVGQLEQTRAALKQAETNLARTAITAPTTGWVAKLLTAKGNYAQTGQTLMMFVPRDVWVTANFKETQIGEMRPGQPVDIYVDAYPGRVFRGHVDSIQAGSGAAFSLLPPENATGNFVKVVQRVPVKIVFDQQPQVYLGPGMSVEPYVRVR
jgi:membrane fusion protein (multidrug efflux system)